MALSNVQYQALMLQYSQRRERHLRELKQRESYVFARIPEYKALDQSVADLSLASLKKRLYKNASPEENAADDASLRGDVEMISKKKAKLLADAGLPADYLEPVYDCPTCHDTGYVDGRKCKCLRAAEIQILYNQSHLEKLAQTNNFAVLSESYYQGEHLQNFKRAELACRSFLNHFDTDYENLCFYGTVGTGKSFLSICTAQEVLKMGHSVLYFSASGLFDRIAAHVFDNSYREDREDFFRDLYDCELLVIDDLGTEQTNGFVAAQLFKLINMRHINQNSTIISTNLSLEELRDRYSDRIFSRITSEYKACKLTGPDIRILKKVRKNGTNQTTR